MGYISSKYTDSGHGEMEQTELSEVASLVCGRFLYSRGIAHQSLEDHREGKRFPITFSSAPEYSSSIY